MSAEGQHAGSDTEPSAAGPTILKVYYMSRRKRLRAIAVLVAVMIFGGYVVSLDPGFRLNRFRDVILVIALFGVLFTLSAEAIERLFSPQPTLIATSDGVILLPRFRPDRVLPWADIDRFEVFRFGRLSPNFVTLVARDAAAVSAQLTLFYRLAFWADRTYVGEPRYFRSRDDFEEPAATVVAELNAFKETYA